MADSKLHLSKNLKTALVYTLICVSVILIVILLDVFEVFSQMEHRTQDMRFRIRGVESHTDDIIIVGIDP